MNWSISTPFIKYPIATSLIMIGVLFVGLVAFNNLPVAPLPQIDFPTIQVEDFRHPQFVVSDLGRLTLGGDPL